MGSPLFQLLIEGRPPVRAGCFGCTVQQFATKVDAKASVFQGFSLSQVAGMAASALCDSNCESFCLRFGGGPAAGAGGSFFPVRRFPASYSPNIGTSPKGHCSTAPRRFSRPGGVVSRIRGNTLGPAELVVRGKLKCERKNCSQDGSNLGRGRTGIQTLSSWQPR